METDLPELFTVTRDEQVSPAGVERCHRGATELFRMDYQEYSDTMCLIELGTVCLQVILEVDEDFLMGKNFIECLHCLAKC